MACKSKKQPLLQFLAYLVAICWASPSSIYAVRILSALRVSNQGCHNFSVDRTCVQTALSDNHVEINYALAFVNLEATPDAYTLSVVWTAYPSGSQQYQRIIWSANRNQPVKVGASWTFSPNGSLALHDSDGSKVWSTYTHNSGVTGLDMNSTSGELTLVGARNRTVWSSFSQPTDTLVAGQQLVWPGMQLVSGNSSTNNSEGPYSLVMEPAGLVLYASLSDPQPYFVWNYFAQSQEPMPVSSLLKTCHNPVTLGLSFNGEVGFSDSSRSTPSPVNSQTYTSQALCNLRSNYSIIKTSSYPNKANTTFMVLESDGNLRVYSYTLRGILTTDYDFFNSTQCDLPRACGTYGVCKANGLCECPKDSILSTNASDPTVGCSTSQGSLGTSCAPNSQVRFGQVTAVDYFSNRFSAPVGTNISMTQCENVCAKNCSCTASFYNSQSGACYSVFEQLSSIRSSRNFNLTASVKISTVAASVAAPPSIAPQKKKVSSNDTAIWIGAGVSWFVIISLVIFGLVIYFRSVYRKARLDRQSKENVFLQTLAGLPPRYTKKEVDAATMGFTKKLGSGGFGTVYEGTLRDGSKVAVKKLEKSKSTKDFRAEMATLGSIHHINLVRLRGFCVEGPHNMLVYEFMPNGSLDSWLFNHDSEAVSLMSDSLNWDTRFKIALGTARGLAYLHQDCSERIIHLDVKPQNILLDENFNPKVGDFGLSKLVDRDETSVVTTMRGTPGYLAPEWLLQATITERTDVYSYGIVLLELVVGRRCLDLSTQDGERRYVPGWVLRCVLQGDILEAVDPRLGTIDNEEQVINVIHIALECIQEEMHLRPSMANIVQMLEGFVPVPDFNRDTLTLLSKYRFLNRQDIDIWSDQSLGSRSSYGDQSLWSRSSYGDQSLCSRRSYGDQSLCSRSSYGDQSLGSRNTCEDHSLGSRNTCEDHSLGSRNISGDQSLSSRNYFGDQSLSSRSISSTSKLSFSSSWPPGPNSSPAKFSVLCPPPHY